MTRIRTVKTNFTAGIVSPQLLGRGDLRAYDNGALDLQNLFIYPTGGLTRRAGLRYVDTHNTAQRLIAYEFNTQQTYLLVMSDLQIKIYLNDALVSTVPSPFTAAQIPQVCWAQSADTLLLTHPDVQPRALTRSATGAWSMGVWNFATVGTVVYMPFYRFAAGTIGIGSSGTTGNVTLTASSTFFQAGHVGTKMKINGKQVTITAVTSGTAAAATVIETLTGTAVTTVWQEQAFSAVRGWPVTVAFHQDRLVIGGSRDLPNRMWFSRSGDLFNFNLGTGLDDDAIEFMLLSDQVNAIRGLYAGRHLQVFTSGAEWMVTGDPLTPTTLQVTRQTRVGSVSSRYVPPVDVDGATLFINRSGDEIREFLYTDVEQAYQASDLTVLAGDLITGAIDQDFDPKRRLLFVVLENGRFATLTLYRAEQVMAWTMHTTDGAVKAVTVVGDTVYLLVQRGSTRTIERFDDNLQLDAAIAGSSPSPQTYWTGLGHLEGRAITVVADGVLRAPVTVTGGEIMLIPPAREVLAGLSYEHAITPLPPSQLANEGAGLAARLVAITLRLQDTQKLELDVGRGMKTINLDNANAGVYAPFSGDVRVRAYGWHKSLFDGLWGIAQDEPYAFRLLSVTTEYKVND